MAHRSPKNPLDFGGNPDQVTLGLMLVRIRVTVDVPCHIGRTVLRLGEVRGIPRNTGRVLSGLCSIVIKGTVEPWWGYALY